MPSARFFLRRLIYAVVSLAILALTVFLFSKVGGDPVAMLLEPAQARPTSTHCASSSASISLCWSSTSASSATR